MSTETKKQNIPITPRRATLVTNPKDESYILTLKRVEAKRIATVAYLQNVRHEIWTI